MDLPTQEAAITRQTERFARRTFVLGPGGTATTGFDPFRGSIASRTMVRTERGAEALPLAANSEEDMTNDRLILSALSHDEGLRVLLVEDNPGDARLIRELLAETEGLVAELTIATRLSEALDHLRDASPDVALLDLGLPDASGIEAVEAVAGVSPNLPIVVLTGLEDGATALEALRVGAQDYLEKNHLEGRLLARALRYAIERMRIYQRAQEAIRARDRVLGFVAHDLRSPLSTIAMSAELLLDDHWSAEQRSEQLHIIRRSAARMDRLIDDLLDVARIENGRLLLDLKRQDPEALIQEATELNTALAAAHSLRMEVESAGPSGPILVDHDRMMQVLSNLIGNAIKFTPAGGRIVVRAERSGEWAKFSVEDNGPGIPAEDLEHLFDPFWQGRRRGSGGAGLGLTIARGIVDAHGGTIWPESEIGGGTTMFFTIPLAGERRATNPVALEDPSRPS